MQGWGKVFLVLETDIFEDNNTLIENYLDLKKGKKCHFFNDIYLAGPIVGGSSDATVKVLSLDFIYVLLAAFYCYEFTFSLCEGRNKATQLA